MLTAWRDGVRRVNSAPAILLGLWVATVVLTIPFTLEIRDRVEGHLGASLEGNAAATGVNYDWLQDSLLTWAFFA